MAVLWSAERSYDFTIECNRVENHWLDQINLEFLNLRTDANGCIYLPVYDTVFRRSSVSTPYGYTVDFPTLGWCQTSAQSRAVAGGCRHNGCRRLCSGRSAVRVPPSLGPIWPTATRSNCWPSAATAAISPAVGGCRMARRRRVTIKPRSPLRTAGRRGRGGGSSSALPNHWPRTRIECFARRPRRDLSVSARSRAKLHARHSPCSTRFRPIPARSPCGWAWPRARERRWAITIPARGPIAEICPKDSVSAKSKRWEPPRAGDYRFQVLLRHPPVDEQLRLFAIDDQQQEHTTGRQLSQDGLPAARRAGRGWLRVLAAAARHDRFFPTGSPRLSMGGVR